MEAIHPDNKSTFIKFVTSREVIINLILAVVLAIVGTILFTGILQPSSTPSPLVTNCTLNIVSGNVEIQKNQTSSWVSGNDGDTLSIGDVLRTAADSNALLTFFEGSTLKIGPESTIEIQQISQSETNQTKIVLKQLVGTTWSRVLRMADPGSRYEIVTPAAYAAVRGTEFQTAVDDKGTTTLQVSRGTVAVQAQGQEVLVSAGYQVNVEPGAVPEEPKVTVINSAVSTNIDVITPNPAGTPALTPIPSPPAASFSDGGREEWFQRLHDYYLRSWLTFCQYFR
jgi:hypothetical protein